MSLYIPKMFILNPIPQIGDAHHKGTTFLFTTYACKAEVVKSGHFAYHTLRKRIYALTT